MSAATIVDARDFNAFSAAEKIDRLLRANDKKGVLEYLTSISTQQRRQIKAPYAERYGEQLLEVLKKKFSGDAEELVVSLLSRPQDNDVRHLREAMKGLGAKEDVLIEILCSRTADQLYWLPRLYKEQLNRSLEVDVEGETSGDVRDILLALIRGSREVSGAVDERAAYAHAADLIAEGKLAGPKKGPPSLFQRLAVTLNPKQFGLVLTAYENETKTSVETQIEKELSGDVEKAYLALARSATNRSRYFAIELKKAMKGLGTDEAGLIRAIVARAEVDLEFVKQEYFDLYKKQLADDVKSETSGLFQQGLLSLIQGNRNHF